MSSTAAAAAAAAAALDPDDQDDNAGVVAESALPPRIADDELSERDRERQTLIRRILVLKNPFDLLGMCVCLCSSMSLCDEIV